MGKDSVGCGGWVGADWEVEEGQRCRVRMAKVYGGERKVWYLCRRGRRSGTVKMLHVPVLKMKFKRGDFEVDFRRQFSSENNQETPVLGLCLSSLVPAPYFLASPFLV